MPNQLTTFIILSALGSGLMAGLFFAFSVTVMRGLARLAPAEGIAAMKSINITIINPWFAIVFFGTGIVSAVVVVWSIVRGEAGYHVAGGVLYLIGSLMITFLFNIPLNNKLAALQSGESGSTEFWQHYLSRWTAWNHLRTVLTLTATALFIISLWKA